MVNYKHADLFKKDSIAKHITIEYDTTVITNEDLFSQEYTLEESLCSEPALRFGSCEASVIKFRVANIVSPMINKWITVKMYLEGYSDNAFTIGKYKVAEDKITADRKWRDIVAYDALYDIINADVGEWYNTILPDKDSTVTMRQFRTSFIEHFGLQQQEITLTNDNMTVAKTIAVTASSEDSSGTGYTSTIGETLSGMNVITAICEINGCFGHIGRDGKFHWIYLPQAIQGLYPANDLYPDHAPDYLPYQQRTGHLYPQDPKAVNIGKDGTYISCHYEDYICKSIDKLQIRQEENDIGVIVGRDGSNCYIIEDNFLVYGKGTTELQTIANNIFNKITDVVYRPFGAECKGNPCLEVGDPVRLTTKYEIVESYILQRTLKGTQALKDAYSADGMEIYTEQVNGVHRSIMQLKGKSNVLERNIEETRLEMTNMEAGLKNEISVTAQGLQANITKEQKRAEGEEEKLSNSIKVNAEGLTAEIKRATKTEGDLQTSIKVLAGKIVLKVNDSGQIALVQLSAEPEKGTIFKVKAGNLQLSAEEVINIMAGGNLNLSGKNIVINSDNFSVSKDGTVRCYKVVEFGIEGNAQTSFNGYVSSSPAVTDLTDVYNQLSSNQQQIQATVNNLNNTIIPQINTWIVQLSDQLRALGQPGIS